MTIGARDRDNSEHTAVIWGHTMPTENASLLDGLIADEDVWRQLDICPATWRNYERRGLLEGAPKIVIGRKPYRRSEQLKQTPLFTGQPASSKRRAR